MYRLSAAIVRSDFSISALFSFVCALISRSASSRGSSSGISLTPPSTDWPRVREIRTVVASRDLFQRGAAHHEVREVVVEHRGDAGRVELDRVDHLPGAIDRDVDD